MAVESANVAEFEKEGAADEKRDSSKEEETEMGGGGREGGRGESWLNEFVTICEREGVLRECAFINLLLDDDCEEFE